MLWAQVAWAAPIGDDPRQRELWNTHATIDLRWQDGPIWLGEVLGAAPSATVRAEPSPLVGATAPNALGVFTHGGGCFTASFHVRLDSSGSILSPTDWQRPSVALVEPGCRRRLEEGARNQGIPGATLVELDVWLLGPDRLLVRTVLRDTDGRDRPAFVGAEWSVARAP